MLQVKSMSQLSQRSIRGGSSKNPTYLVLLQSFLADDGKVFQVKHNCIYWVADRLM
jgi:hypothetical protein